MEWTLYRGEYSASPIEDNPLGFTVRAKECRTSWVIWIEDNRGFRASPKRVLFKPIVLDLLFQEAETTLMKYVQMYERRISYS